jgi:flagellar motor switch/type III secretory pathway protein FliN
VSDRVSRVEEIAPIHPAPDWADLKVAATIELDGGRLTAAQMATLGEGSVLQLPAGNGTLAVRIVAGGAVIADGELVAVGDGFGVLVTALRATDSATA